MIFLLPGQELQISSDGDSGTSSVFISYTNYNNTSKEITILKDVLEFNSATNFTLCTCPAGSTRQIRSLYITNSSAGIRKELTIKIDNNGNKFSIFKGLLGNLETLFFDGDKFKKLDNSGQNIKMDGLPNITPKLVERFAASGDSSVIDPATSGYKFIMYKLWGAGGGGGGGAYGTTNVARHGGAGGGGGACLQGVMAVDANTPAIPATAFSSFVYSIAVQSDGKIVVGGQFISYNNVTQKYITRLNSDGTRDTGFSIGTGFSQLVATIAIQSDGKIVVGGQFISYNGTTQNYITRLNSDGTRDTGFSIGTGFNSAIQSIAIQSDGKIVVGGNFTSYDGTTQNYITRLNSDGTRDTGFTIGTGFNNIVNRIAIQSDGKIVVGGTFTSYDGTTQNYITRLNSDGTRDTGFTIGSGFGSSVTTIAIQTDGKILVGGNFTSYDGTTQNYITRLNSDGTRDTGFSIGTGFSSLARPIAIQSDGKILVGGDFTSYNGTTQNRITRLNSDGTRDTSFSIGTGFDNASRPIAIQSDGKIVVGGNFTSYDGTTQNFITRLNSDGTRDTSFNAGTRLIITIGAGGTGGAGAGTTVGPGQAGTAGGDTYINNSNLIAYGGGGGAPGTNAAAATSGGGGGGTASAGATGTATAAAGGRPGTAASTGVAGGTGASSTITATVAGTVATLCAEYGGAAGAGQPATASGGSSGGSSLFGGGGGGHGACQSSTQTLLAAGQGGNSNSYVAGGGTGSTNLYLGIFGGSGGVGNIVNGFNDSVHPIAIQTDGKILVGGIFTSYNGTTQNSITRLNSDGTRDTGFTIGTGFSGVVYDWVYSIAIQTDGKIVVGGWFDSYDGTTQNYITRLNSDGTRDTGFTIGSGFGSSVITIAIQSDGKILVGGSFTSYNGTTQNRITRLNSDGTRDTGFTIGTGFNLNVESIDIQTDGKIVAGGAFTSYNGTTQNYITRLNNDGTRDTSFNIGTGLNNWVYSVAIQSDGKILVGGSFTSYNGTTQNRITRLNSDGTRDTSFNIGTGFSGVVYSIAIQSDGKIMVVGLFSTYDGTTQNYITRLNSDGTRDTSFSIGTGFDNYIRSIAIQSDGKILVGGNFTSYNGTTQNRITRLNSDGTRDTSFNNIDGINGSAGGGGGGGGSSGNATVEGATDGGNGGDGYAILYWW